jgi:hypothetical protein
MINCSLQFDYPKNSFLKACKSDSINYGYTSAYSYHVDSPLNDNNSR